MLLARQASRGAVARLSGVEALGAPQYTGPPGRGAGLLSRCPSRRGLFRGPSVANSERRAVLGPARAPVIEPGCAYVGVAEPVLDAGDVGVVLEGVGGGRGP